MEKIPLESFRRLTAQEGVTSIKTTLRNYDDSIRLVVVEDTTDDIRTYYGYLLNDDNVSEEEVIKLYSNRWGIEFWFDECQFLGINDVPSIELNEVTMHMAMNLIAYNSISAFRANLGKKYVPMNAETIDEKFIKEQALVKLRDDQITGKDEAITTASKSLINTILFHNNCVKSKISLNYDQYIMSICWRHQVCMH